MEQLGKKYLNIEDEFFELDHEQNTAIIRMEYEKPSDIIESSTVTKTPRLSGDFVESLIGIFDYLPLKYKLHIQVAFDDMHLDGGKHAEGDRRLCSGYCGDGTFLGGYGDLFHRQQGAEKKTAESQKEIRGH